MAFIAYVPPDTLPESDRVADPDNIIQIHAIHPAVMRQHYELYKSLILRDAGLDDRAIHDACAIIGYAFVNRIADGLGVDVEAT